MITASTDMKPSKRIFENMQPFTKFSSLPEAILAIQRIAKILDEQHAAGQVPVAAVGADDGCPLHGKSHMEPIGCVYPGCTFSHAPAARLSVESMRAQVAAPPAQSARDESCQECGVVGGRHRFECMARYKQPAQPTAVEPKHEHVGELTIDRATGAEFCEECDPAIEEPDTRSPFQIRNGLNGDGTVRVPAAEPAVPVAGERLNELVNRIKSVLPMTMRNESECDARLALRAIEGAYARMERERGFALSGKLEAERVAAGLSVAAKELEARVEDLAKENDAVRDVLLAADWDVAPTLQEAVTKLIAEVDGVRILRRSACEAFTAAKKQVEALTKERDQWKFDAEYNVKLTELREAKRLHQEADEECQKLDDVVRELGGNHENGAALFIRETHASLTAEKERAERLEAACREAVRRANRNYGECDGLLLCQVSRATLIEDLSNALRPELAETTPSVATGERAHLVVGDKVRAKWMAPGVAGEVIQVDGSAIPYKVSYLKLLPTDTWAQRKDLELLTVDPPTTPTPLTESGNEMLSAESKP